MIAELPEYELHLSRSKALSGAIGGRLRELRDTPHDQRRVPQHRVDRLGHPGRQLASITDSAAAERVPGARPSRSCSAGTLRG